MMDSNVVRKLIEAGCSDDVINEYLQKAVKSTAAEPTAQPVNHLSETQAQSAKPAATPTTIIGPGVLATSKPKRKCSEKQLEGLARGRATAAANRAKAKGLK